MSSLTVGTTANHNTDFGPATLSLVADAVPGTSLTQALDVTIPANASRTYGPVEVAHGVPVKAGELWTMSFYARKVTGVYNQFMACLCNNQFQNHLIPGNNFQIQGGWTDLLWHRFVFSFTAAADATVAAPLTNGQNAFYLQTTDPITAAVQFRLSGFQLEPGGVATPFA